MNAMRLILGDCLEVLPTLENASVDMVCADPPYGTTACQWDSIIPLEPMWKELRRIIKPRGAIVMTASQPFTSALVMSNPEWFRHEWTWEKSRPSGFVNCNFAPLKNHEQVLVFAVGRTIYVPQMDKALRRVEGVRTVKAHKAVCQADRGREFNNDGLAYPRSVLKIPNPNHDNDHPTQKPVALMRYLIRTYTNEPALVLDFCMGSGTCGVACQIENRDFIGIEKDEAYFKIAQRRIHDASPEVVAPLFAGAGESTD